MSKTPTRSYFRRDDAKTTNNPQSASKPTTKSAEKPASRPAAKPIERLTAASAAKPAAQPAPKTKGARPFEQFRKDNPKALKKQERSKIFTASKFVGKADSYSERVAIERPERRGGRTKREDQILKEAAKHQTQSNEPMRLNRFVAQSGVCSRREADELIAQGLITVNGAVVTELGSKVSREDRVEYEGKMLQGEKKIYILMNKPKGYVTSVDDPHNDRTVIDLLKGQVPQRVYPVGRLDKNTTGVLMLTNDGDLTRELTHPSYNKSKIYHVFLDKSCTEAHLEQLLDGITLEDGEAKVDQISFVAGSHKEIGVELHSGRNRIVRRMFEHLGYEVQKLDRVYFAGLTKLGLRRGFWRILTDKEVAMLKSRNYK